MAFSPDGASLLTATWKVLSLWNATTGQLVRTYEGSAETLAAFSPDGRQIAAVVMTSPSGRYSIRILDAVTGTAVKTFRKDSYKPETLSYSTDGSMLLLGTLSDSGAPSAEIWDVSAGALTRSVPHAEIAYGAGFSPDGLRFYTASGTTAFQWATEAQDPVRLMENQDAVLTNNYAPVALPRRHRVATTEERSRGSGKRPPEFGCGDFIGHTGYLNSLAFSPDGAKVLTASNDSTAKLWSVADRTSSGPSRATPRR